MNLTAKWEVGRYMHVYATASRFFACTFLRQTGSSRDVDFLQAEVFLRF